MDGEDERQLVVLGVGHGADQHRRRIVHRTRLAPAPPAALDAHLQLLLQSHVLPGVSDSLTQVEISFIKINRRNLKHENET